MNVVGKGTLERHNKLSDNVLQFKNSRQLLNSKVSLNRFKLYNMSANFSG